MISEHEFNQDEEEDFTNNFAASLEQDYVTLFKYPKEHEKDPIAVGKNAAKLSGILRLWDCEIVTI